MFIKWFFCGFLIFSSCSKSYTHLADSIFSRCANEMKAKHGLSLSGAGGSMPNRDVKSLHLSFDLRRNVDIEEARKIYIEIVECLVRETNEDKNIQPYLHSRPFKRDNVEVDLSFVNDNGRFLKDGNLCCILNIKDNLIYYTFESKTQKLIKIYSEPYEEALRIVQQSK